MTRPAIEPADEDLMTGPTAQYTVPDRLKDDGAAVAAIKRKAEMDLRAAVVGRVKSIEGVRSYRARAVWPDDEDALEPFYEPVTAATGDVGDATVYVLRAMTAGPSRTDEPLTPDMEAAGEFALEAAERDRSGWTREQIAADAVAIVNDPRFTMAALTEAHVRALVEAVEAYAADFRQRNLDAFDRELREPIRRTPEPVAYQHPDR